MGVCLCVRACFSRHAGVSHILRSFTLNWQCSLCFNPPHVLLSQLNIIRRLLLLLKKSLDSGSITGHSNLDCPTPPRGYCFVWQLPIIHCTACNIDAVQKNAVLWWRLDFLIHTQNYMLLNRPSTVCYNIWGFLQCTFSLKPWSVCNISWIHKWQSN